jgi:copper chaperone CopZ
MQTEHLNVTGMTCGGCTSKVTRALKAMRGVGDASVSLAAGETSVHYDERLISIGQIKAAIEGAGFGVNLSDIALAINPKAVAAADMLRRPEELKSYRQGETQ